MSTSNPIKIDKNFTIKHSNSSGWILSYKSDSTTGLIKVGPRRGEIGEAVSKDQWYYPDLKTALKKYLDKAIGVSEECSSVADLIAKIEGVEENIIMSIP